MMTCRPRQEGHRGTGEEAEERNREERRNEAVGRGNVIDDGEGEGSGGRGDRGDGGTLRRREREAGGEWGRGGGGGGGDAGASGDDRPRRKHHHQPVEVSGVDRVIVRVRTTRPIWVGGCRCWNFVKRRLACVNRTTPPWPSG